MDLIDRYRKWKLTHANESDSESDNSDADGGDDADSDWDIGTIREPSAAAAAAAAGVAAVEIGGEYRGGEGQLQMNGGGEGDLSRKSSSSSSPPPSYSSDFTDPSTGAPSSPIKRSASPVKSRLEQQEERERDGSPLRDNNRVARSDLNIVSLIKTTQWLFLPVLFFSLFQPRSVADSRNSRSMEHLDHRPLEERPDRSLAAATAANAAAAAASAAAMQRRQTARPAASVEEDRRRRQQQENRKSAPPMGASPEQLQKPRLRDSPARGASAVLTPPSAVDETVAAAGAGSPSRSAAIMQNTVQPLLSEVPFQHSFVLSKSF